MTKTLDNICKALEVLNNKKATARDIGRIVGLLSQLSFDIDRYVRKYAHDLEHYDLDFMSGDLEMLADASDFHLRRLSQNLNYRQYWKLINEMEKIDDKHFIEFVTGQTDRFNALRSLRSFSSCMHLLAVFLKCLELQAEQGTIEYAMLSAIQEFLGR